MGAVDLGQKATVKWPTAPASGAYALAVKRPDGTLLSPAPTVTGTGASVQAQFVPSMAGRHLLSWSVAGEAAYTDILDVWPADPRFIIPLDDAQEALNFAGRAPASAVADLRLYVAAATPVIEDITGPMVVNQKSFTGSGGRGSVVLPDDATEVVSVVVEGVTFAPATWVFPGDGSYPTGSPLFWEEYGVVYAGSRTSPSTFPPGGVAVVYKVGSAVIPPNVQLAARELVRHWWQTSKQATGGSRPEPPTGEVFTPSGFAVPRRVIELCEPHRRVGGFA